MYIDDSGTMDLVPELDCHQNMSGWFLDCAPPLYKILFKCDSCTGRYCWERVL